MYDEWRRDPVAFVHAVLTVQDDLAPPSQQVTKYRNHPDVSPGGKRQVLFVAPNVSIADRKRFEQDNGVRVFGSSDHLKNHLKRHGLC